MVSTELSWQMYSMLIFLFLRKDEILDAEVVERMAHEHSSEVTVRNSGSVRLVDPNLVLH